MPVLVSLGPVKLYSFGFFLFVGLILGLYFWWKLGRDEHYDETALFDAFFLGLIAFFVVGRSGYIALHSEDLGTVYRFIAFLRYPGLSYVSGIVGAVTSIFLFARSRSWNTWKILDSLAVTLAIILVIGSMGAFLNGSNPGREMAIGLTFPEIPGKRFPIDLLGSLWFLAAFAVTSRVRRSFRFYTWYKGDASEAKDGLAALVFLAFAGVYFVFRGFLDDVITHISFIPLMSIGGLIMVLLTAVLVRSRSGKGGKLRGGQS